MNPKLLEYLLPITDEEQKILESGQIDASLYTDNGDFVIDFRKLLHASRLIEIRASTRFIHFPPHRHNYIEFVYNCSGITTHFVNNDEIVLAEGCMLFLGQRAVHEILPAKERDIAINFIIHPKFFQQKHAGIIFEEHSPISNFFLNCLLDKDDGLSYLHFEVPDVLPVQNLIENLVWDLSHADSHRHNTIHHTMALLLLNLMNYTDKIMDNFGDKDEKLRVACLKYIDESYREASLGALAEMLNYSPSWLSRHIKKHTGKTFIELVHERRMSQALYLLQNTTMPITEIIYLVGYENSSFFYKKFRQLYGVLPKEMRK